MSNTMEFFQDGENKIKYCNSAYTAKTTASRVIKQLFYLVPDIRTGKDNK